MKFLPGPETREAVLKHPFVLAGVAVVVLLGLTAGALVVVDSARGGTEPQQVVIEPETVTPGPVVKTAEATGVHGTTKRVSSVRSAPGPTTPLVGTVPAKSDLVIDGRTTDTKWYRVIFPPRSELHAWIDADMVDVTGDAASLAVATAEPPVVVATPKSRFTPEAPIDTPIPEPTNTPTVVVEGLPDLVLSTTPIITGGKLFVTVVNQGTGTARGDLVVAVFLPDNTKLVGGVTLPNFTLPPGLSIDVGTGVGVAGTQPLLVIVDPNGEIAETDDLNNRVTITVSGEEPPPADTETPPPAPPPVP